MVKKWYRLIHYQMYFERVSIVVARIFFNYIYVRVGPLKNSFFEGGSLEIIELKGVGHAKVLWRHNQFHQPTLSDRKWMIPKTHALWFTQTFFFFMTESWIQEGWEFGTEAFEETEGHKQYWEGKKIFPSYRMKDTWTHLNQ